MLTYLVQITKPMKPTRLDTAPSQLASHIDARQLTPREAYAYYSDAYRKSKPLTETLQQYADRLIAEAGGVYALI